MLGIFENDLPKIEIEIWGLSPESKKVLAIVDTGNNGYLTLPYVEAFPLGLVLRGIQSSSMANGSLTHYLVCTGVVICDSKRVITTMDIQPQCPILIGNKLLKLLGKKLNFEPTTGLVELVDASPQIEKQK